ncbi:acetyltransferase, GNAT family [Enterococcus faecalis 06-MB-DW-09]|nr:acetyltransferase, GNAT family [Enterococcus faecalis 06-MB-DW-09]
MIQQVTQFTDSELETIAQIWLQSNLDAHDFISAALWQDNYDFVKKAFSDALIYTYSVDDQPVGFIGMLGDYIAGIFVLKDYRAHGIGKQLLQKAQAEHEKLTLNVYKKNTAAIAFYLKNGFTIVSEQLDSDTNEIENSMEWHR